MKKLITIAFLLVISLMGNSLNAQTRFGVKAGMNRTNIRFYHPLSIPRYGFQVGGFAYIPLNDIETLYVQPELFYMQHGERNQGDLFNGDYLDEKYYIDYIRVPILLKAYLSDRYNAFFVEGGPAFSFKINQTTASNQSTPTYLSDYGEDGDKVAPFDFSVSLGIGFSYERQWEIDLRYSFGITDVYPEAVGENQARTNNSHSLGVTLAYIFD